MGSFAEYARWVLEPELPVEPTPARSSYFVCSVQRSGTWLLAGLLDSTGVAGHPHEYFDPATEESNRRRWGLASFEEYLERVLEVGTTQNGVFGSLLMWNNLGRLDPLGGAFPEPRLIHLWREDVAAQAVSWSLASQTGYYHHWDTPRGEPRYSFDEISGLARLAAESTECWRRWFREHGVEPLEVRFEDLVADQAGTSRRVLDYLGLELPPGTDIEARTAPASPEMAQEWLDRYCRERRA